MRLSFEFQVAKIEKCGELGTVKDKSQEPKLEMEQDS